MDDVDEDLAIARRDYEKIKDSCSRTGYVEGTEVGKDNGLKEGFVEGFISGMAACTHSAILVGKISAIKVWLEGDRSHSSTESSSQELLMEIEKLRTLMREFEDEASKDMEQMLQNSREAYIRKVESKDRVDSKCRCSSWASCEGADKSGDTHKPFISLVNSFPPSLSVKKFSMKLDRQNT